MTEKRHTSQGYIIRILQHFATKLWNTTNFVMLFQAVMKFGLDQNLVYNANDPLISHNVSLNTAYFVLNFVVKFKSSC
jgi:hypothetical protein